MNRRKFFGLSIAAATMPASAAVVVEAHAMRAGAGPVGRVSMEEGDPGFRAYCMARGDRKTVRVFLDGIEQRYATTADAVEGWVERGVRTPEGNLAHDGERMLRETVYGAVRIEIV